MAEIDPEFAKIIRNIPGTEYILRRQRRQNAATITSGGRQLKKRFIEWNIPLAEISEEFLREFKIDENIYATDCIIPVDRLGS